MITSSSFFYRLSASSAKFSLLNRRIRVRETSESATDSVSDRGSRINQSIINVRGVYVAIETHTEREISSNICKNSKLYRV